MNDYDHEIEQSIAGQLLRAEAKIRDRAPGSHLLNDTTDADYELIVAFLEGDLSQREANKLRRRLEHEESLRALLGVYCASIRDTEYGAKIFGQESARNPISAVWTNLLAVVSPIREGDGFQWAATLAMAGIALVAVIGYGLFSGGGSLTDGGPSSGTQVARTMDVSTAIGEANRTAQGMQPSERHLASTFRSVDLSQARPEPPLPGGEWQDVAAKAGPSVMLLQTRSGFLTGFQEADTGAIVSVSDAAKSTYLAEDGRLYVEAHWQSETGADDTPAQAPVRERTYLYQGDPGKDLAIFRRDGQTRPASRGISLARSDQALQQGVRLGRIALGTGDALWQFDAGTITKEPTLASEVSALGNNNLVTRRLSAEASVLLTSIPGAGGAPGAPVLTERGEVAGICALAAAGETVAESAYWYLTASTIESVLEATPAVPESRAVFDPEQWHQIARATTTDIFGMEGGGAMILGRNDSRKLVFMALDSGADARGVTLPPKVGGGNALPDGFDAEFLWVVAAAEESTYTLYSRDDTPGLDEIRVDNDGDARTDMLWTQEDGKFSVPSAAIPSIDPWRGSRSVALRRGQTLHLAADMTHVSSYNLFENNGVCKFLLPAAVISFNR